MKAAAVAGNASSAPNSEQQHGVRPPWVLRFRPPANLQVSLAFTSPLADVCGSGTNVREMQTQCNARTQTRTQAQEDNRAGFSSLCSVVSPGPFEHRRAGCIVPQESAFRF